MLVPWASGCQLPRHHLRSAPARTTGPSPIARMIALLFDAEGVYGHDIRSRIEHQSSIDVFHARGGSPASGRAGRSGPGSVLAPVVSVDVPLPGATCALRVYPNPTEPSARISGPTYE
jgi:hypothetical protein